MKGYESGTKVRFKSRDTLLDLGHYIGRHDFAQWAYDEACKHHGKICTVSYTCSSYINVIPDGKKRKIEVNWSIKHVPLVLDIIPDDVNDKVFNVLRG